MLQSLNLIQNITLIQIDDESNPQKGALLMKAPFCMTCHK